MTWKLIILGRWRYTSSILADYKPGEVSDYSDNQRDDNNSDFIDSWDGFSDTWNETFIYHISSNLGNSK